MDPGKARVQAPEEGLVRVRVDAGAGRAALLRAARLHLPRGEALVEIRDLVGRRRTFTTVPSDARARLVAFEAPLVLRGALTALVTYWRTPSDPQGLAAREIRREPSGRLDVRAVRLRPVVEGRAVARHPGVAA